MKTIAHGSRIVMAVAPGNGAAAVPPGRITATGRIVYSYPEFNATGQRTLENNTPWRKNPAAVLRSMSTPN